MSRRQRGSADPGRAGSRPPEHRVGNSVFYVVAEGKGTEQDYLSGLNRTYGSTLRFLIKTPSPSVQKNGLTPSRVVEEACRAADEPAISQIWGLFDHDGRKDIDQVCLRQKPDRVRVALSHPSFELWLLLHFQEFSPVAQSGDNDEIIKKLRAVHRAFADYEKPNKRISLERFAALDEGDGIRKAVRRARSLSRHFTHETPSQRDPSTACTC